MGALFPRRPFMCRLSRTGWKKCEDLFRKIDGDGKLILTKEKANAFFIGGFTNIAVEAMFNEVDIKETGTITPDDWMAFWVQVRKSGYKESDILEEVSNLSDGNPWVDWKDGRKT